MNQIRWARGGWLIGGVLIWGVLLSVAYGQAPVGRAPAAPTPGAATAGPSSSPDKVVLKVGDKSITQGEIERFIQGLNPQVQNALAQQGRRPVGDQLVNLLLLSQEALSRHLDSTPAYQEMLALHRREVLAALAYQEIAQQSAVTPEETRKYYAEHRSDFEEAQIYRAVIRKKPAGAKEGTPGLTAEEAKTRAEQIRRAWSSGDDPKKVAEKYQMPSVVRVDATPETVHRGQMRPDMDKAAFELKPGQISEVFDLGQALTFLRVVSHDVEEFKDVSRGIEGTLQQQKINSALDALKKKANVWMDDGYFAPPSRPQPQGAIKPQVVLGAPTTPK